jgi:hypothetical protein
VALLKYMGTAITDEAYIHEDIKFQECLPAFSSETYDFIFVTNNLQIKISRNVVLPGVSYDVKHGLSLE